MKFKCLIICLLCIMFDPFIMKKMKLSQPLMGLGTESFINKLPKPMFKQRMIINNNDRNNNINAEIIPHPITVPTNLTITLKLKKLNCIIKP